MYSPAVIDKFATIIRKSSAKYADMPGDESTENLQIYVVKLYPKDVLSSSETPEVFSNGTEYARDMKHAIPNASRFQNIVILGPKGLHTKRYLWTDIIKRTCPEIQGIQICKKDRTRQTAELG